PREAIATLNDVASCAIACSVERFKPMTASLSPPTRRHAPSEIVNTALRGAPFKTPVASYSGSPSEAYNGLFTLFRFIEGDWLPFSVVGRSASFAKKLSAQFHGSVPGDGAGAASAAGVSTGAPLNERGLNPNPSVGCQVVSIAFFAHLVSLPLSTLALG